MIYIKLLGTIKFIFKEFWKNKSAILKKYTTYITFYYNSKILYKYFKFINPLFFKLRGHNSYLKKMVVIPHTFIKQCRKSKNYLLKVPPSVSWLDFLPKNKCGDWNRLFDRKVVNRKQFNLINIVVKLLIATSLYSESKNVFTFF